MVICFGCKSGYISEWAWCQRRWIVGNFTGQKALFAVLLAIFFGIKTGDSQMVVKLQLPWISGAADSNLKCNTWSVKVRRCTPVQQTTSNCDPNYEWRSSACGSKTWAFGACHGAATLTYDQGKEMVLHTQLKVNTGIAVYFCNTHRP